MEGRLASPSKVLTRSNPSEEKNHMRLGNPGWYGHRQGLHLIQEARENSGLRLTVLCNNLLFPLQRASRFLL